MIENFQNKTLNYDLKKYPWHEWIKSTINEIFPNIDDLSKIHESLSAEQAVTVCDHVQKSFLSVDYQKKFDQFAEEYGESLIRTKDYLIKRQPTLNLVLPNQESKHRRLPFHQGIWYNNGKGMRTIWMPLTSAYGTNSMYVVDETMSKKISQETIEKKYSLEQFEDLCKKFAKPVELEPGQAHLFHQEHIHGNVNNETGVTRLAIDWHLLPKGLDHGRRLPGGFFRLPGDYIKSKKIPRGNFVAYVGNNTKFDKQLPINYQRSIIDKFCMDNGIKHSGYQFENEHLYWMPILENCIQQKPQGIVMNSIYSLPEAEQRRKEILYLAQKLEVVMLFANEFIICQTSHDFATVEKYFEYYLAQ